MDPAQLAKTLIDEAVATASHRDRRPESTYRLQFHAGFTFRDATEIVPYLQALGITHGYASPYLKARSGSTHGYDIVDHSRLNPEIGTSEEYETWIQALRDHGIEQILDTVPNHMGIGTDDNAWWNDVLENGPASPYASFFDIAWQASTRAELHNKVLLPVLGEPYGDELEAGRLCLVFAEGAFFIQYYDRRFPIAADTYSVILGHGVEQWKDESPADDPEFIEYLSILTAVRNLPDRASLEREQIVDRQREIIVIKRRLGAFDPDGIAAMFIKRNLEKFNGLTDKLRDFDLLDDLLEHQCYRLSYWRVAPDEINYRRFFDVNELAALSMEREDVFLATHELVFQLLAQRKLYGLRIDHPDGLFDPAQYLRRLQQFYLVALARAAFEQDPKLAETCPWSQIEGPLRECAAAYCNPHISLEAGAPNLPPAMPPLYVVVEKILAADEALVDSWPVDGTSGYDFLNQVSGIFVDPAQVAALTSVYDHWINDATTFPELVYRKKLLIMQISLASELHTLTSQLDRLAQKSRRSRDFTFNTLRQSLREVIACFPVYRSYIAEDGPHQDDRRYVFAAIRAAIRRNPLMSRRVFRFIRDMILLESPESFTAEDRADQLRFAGKFQQVTSPVTAKGVEDTAFYVFNRLVSLNEVGGDPGRFGVTTDQFHAYNQARQGRWPYSLSPLSTHDTKRSEDVRARIHVLSEMPGDWADNVKRWSVQNQPHRQIADEFTALDPNEEYLLYQTLIGAWPLDPLTPETIPVFVERIQEYMLKALHEAKVHTSWINPNAEYDEAIRQFVARVLDPECNRAFVDDFQAFQNHVSYFGLFNSLSQTLLKLTAPGVPDTYQGSELWDFSLVDPDNRRPVDYGERQRLLADLNSHESTVTDAAQYARSLVDSRNDGRIKLFVTQRALHYRRAHPGLLSAGEYLPLSVEGSKANHLFAFARRASNDLAIIAVPRLPVGLLRDVGTLPLGESVWQDTRLVLNGFVPGATYRNIFTNEIVIPSEHAGQLVIQAADLFSSFPVAALERTA